MFFNIFLKNSSIELIIIMLGMRNCYKKYLYLAKYDKIYMILFVML